MRLDPILLYSVLKATPQTALTKETVPPLITERKEEAPMKIAFAAPEDAGKTCYLTALYGELSDLINRKKIDAPLSFEWTNTKQDGEINLAFENLLEGVLPKGTEFVTRHSVRACHRLYEGTRTIELVDFPGGRLRSRGEASDVEELTALLSTCDAFIILIDAEHCAKNGIAFRRSIAASRINEILAKAIKQKKGSEYSLNGVPFVFAISKVDKISHDTQLVLKSYQNIMESFPECFSPEADCIAAITQVTLGNNIDADPRKGEKRGEYDPKNILLPFFLALGIGTLSGARYGYKRKQELEDAKEKTFDHYQKEVGYFDQALHKLRRRENASLFERFDQFTNDFTFESTLRDTANRYERDKNNAHAKYDEKHKELARKLKEIETLRIIGAEALKQVPYQVWLGEQTEVDLYKSGERHMINYDLDSEFDQPLVRLKEEAAA